ncbi:right-handed parallel beta-helix repeat-containing protein [Oscillatoria laete-virens NRMC-F 0139]|nr:right-handed parallel beta-helix repeat-containing protein [Oscillatoria laete-virens]MDL5052201.1 right-handed parallel beta-helix repeat-containing protein [Oscillatoria laete-virens NRMC-F 0139]
MKQSIIIFSLAWMIFFCAHIPLSAASWYVSPTGSDANAGNAEDAPLMLIQTAINLASSGDTIYLMNGTHTNNVTTWAGFDAVAWFNGFQDNLTLRNLHGHSPVIQLTGTQTAGVHVNGASGITIEGIEFEGNNRFLTPASAALLPGNDPLRQNTAIWVDDAGGGHIPTDLTIRGNTIRDFGGNGMQIAHTDNLLVEYNIVYNNAWYSEAGNSGISVTELANVYDADLGHRVVIVNNMSYSNRNYFPFMGQILDGNGIILDFANTGGYNGRILVANNVVFDNGGAGLEAYNSDRVDFINNTAFNNSLHVDIDKGNVRGGDSTGSTVLNNILFASPGMNINTGFDAVGLLYDYNLHFDGDGSLLPAQLTFTQANGVEGNPWFVDAAVMDFRLQSISAAIGAGTNVAWMPLADYDGFLRMSPPSIGAFEFDPTPIPEPSTVMALLVGIMAGAICICRGKNNKHKGETIVWEKNS